MKINMFKSIVSALAVTGMFIGVTSMTVAAADADDTIQISGEVQEIATLTIATAAGYNALDLGTTATGTTVGTATEICNSTTGYTVSLSSANAVAAIDKTQATLKTTAGDTLNYTIKYGPSAELALVNGVCAIAYTSDAETDANGEDHAIKVLYTTTWLPAGVYTDTLTLTIAAK
jgi:hypothetical protein